MSQKVYIVANLEVITDKEKFRDYERGLVKALGRHGGTLHSYSDNVECLEGDKPPKGRLVIFSFPSKENVDAWWSDEDYQAASDIRIKYSVTNFIAKLEEQTVAIELEPFDSVISETTLIAYSNSSVSGNTASKALLANFPCPISLLFGLPIIPASPTE